ncbi:MAG: hypothetical protein V1835_06740 [Candidatus Micrarchaeota archaeon]
MKTAYMAIIAILLIPIVLYFLAGVYPFSNIILFNKIPFCEKNFDSREKQGCYGIIAVKNNEPLLCDNMESETEKEVCLSLVARANGETSICEKLTNFVTKDMCFSGVAKKLNNSSICTRISTTFLQNDCVNRTTI